MYMRSVPKVMRMIFKKHFYWTYMQLQFILFKIGSLWSNTAIPALQPLFIAVEEVFTRDVVQSPRRSCLDVFNCPIIMSLRWVLSLGKKEKSHGAKWGLYGGWGSIVILFWTKNSHTSYKFFGTRFTQIFLTCRSSVMIRWTSVFGSPTSSTISHTFKCQSLPRTAFTWATLFLVLEVEGHPACCSSLMLSLLSLNTLCHLKTKQHPHKLSSTTATFRNQICGVSCRT